jgi:hypothetical protein
MDDAYRNFLEAANNALDKEWIDFQTSSQSNTKVPVDQLMTDFQENLAEATAIFQQILDRRFALITYKRNVDGRDLDEHRAQARAVRVGYENYFSLYGSYQMKEQPVS